MMRGTIRQTYPWSAGASRATGKLELDKGLAEASASCCIASSWAERDVGRAGRQVEARSGDGDEGSSARMWRVEE